MSYSNNHVSYVLSAMTILCVFHVPKPIHLNNDKPSNNTCNWYFVNYC